MKRFVFVALLPFCWACNNKPAADPGRPASAPDSLPQIGQQTPAPMTRTFRGLYVLGNEVNTFRDCTTGNTYWVEDATRSLDTLYTRAVQPLPYPYQAVYAVVGATLGPRSTMGYASEYEGVLTVNRVDTLAGKSRFNVCFPFDFWLTGTEPFWDMQISATEKGMFLRDIGHERPAVFPYVKPVVGNNTWTYDVRTEAGQSMRVVIKKEQCSDGMSDAVYPYSAEVQIGETRLRGCALRYGDKTNLD